MSASLAALRARGGVAPAAVALRHHDRVMSYAELSERSTRIADLLARREIRVLAIAADNSPDWVCVDFATQIAGVTLVPLPLFFSAEQVRHALADSGAEAVVVDGAGARLVRVIDGTATETLTGELALLRLPSTNVHRVPERTAKVSYTSGTTGRPKGVALRQEALDCVAESLCSALAETEIERHVCLLPLATLLENVAGVYAPMMRGAEMIVPSSSEVGFVGAASLDVKRMLACLHAHEAQSVILLPQMLAALVAAAEQGMRPPSSLRFAAVGGGVVAASLLERADRLALPIYEGYGLTECASVVALNTPRARRPGSAGRPLAHTRVRIGASGEIFVGGATMTGYVGEPAIDAREIATGDVGRFDSDGFLFVQGRRKNMFITSFGRNVSPDWVEAELANGSAIAQAALFGEARPWNVAVIVPAQGAGVVDIRRDVDTANGALPDYAQVHQWIVAREPFTPANGLATANGRKRRGAIWECYRHRIDACYDEYVGSCA
jgi:long-subunit acyl-CoA synthetase (AMP-forming)